MLTRTMSLLSRFLFLAAFGFLNSCASMRVTDFAFCRPAFRPMEFFAGHTSSSGVIETRGGTPMRIVQTETSGRREGETLKIEQDISVSGSKPQHRSWQIRQLDAHRYEATANDILGPVRGEAYGNVFHWEFTVALSPGNPLENVRFSQWMYLQPDGTTMVNHSTIRKFGIVVAQVTEEFSKR
ncbi:MAG: hypothetical protein DLM52_13190 [Chthoniobacterales bacterium]|nr:MAG: hypothetical protein DLM52_13190 [Chthoniobacterales bacterium]